jgi:hypothetical protein
LYVNNNDVSLVMKGGVPQGLEGRPKSVDISLVRKVEALERVEGSFKV